MTETLLDRAHARMMAAGESEAARRGFFAAVAATPLSVLLEAEPAPGASALRPLVLETGDGRLAFGFDSAERLAAFADAAAATATMPGRDLARLLVPSGLALGLNFEVAPSAILLPAAVLEWIAGIDIVVEADQRQIAGLAPPGDVPGEVLEAIGAALAGVAARAHIARARWNDDTETLALAVVGIAQEAELEVGAALAESVGRAGAEAPALLFVGENSDLARRFARIGLTREAPRADALPGTAPGTDPTRPPRLR